MKLIQYITLSLFLVLGLSSAFAGEKEFYALERAASQGKAVAQYKLGQCYEKGLGTKANAREAFLWYKKAAEKGNSDAQLAVGKCYAEGKGVSKNMTAATRWYKKADWFQFFYNITLLYFIYRLGHG